jgi:hypothetical protein
MYRKNTAGQFITFQLISTTDGSAITGVSPAVRRCIDGTFAAGGGTVTEDTGGYYKYAMSQADTNGNDIGFRFSGTGAITVALNIVTTAADPTDTVRFGLTAMPNVASGSAGAIPTTGTGSNQISVSSGQVILQSGTGTGQLDFTSGVVKSNLAQILGTALTETAGLLAGGFKKFFNVSSPTGTLNSIPDAVAGATGGLFIAGTNAATTVTTALTTTFTGNLTGSVASVTGAVGSVTGNVGGNVTGSVGSLAAQAKTDVNAEVVDALATDTYAEPGQGTPAATTTLAAKINYLYKNWRNKKTQTSSQFSLYADDATTVDQKSATSDDGTTATRGEIATGP